ncbi:MAG: dihydrolipoamide acetyltransferase [Pseudonocardiales bacterium]|nr:MAG: dihydrolipoamide acetyltransferase [Pseudonocardiales bacterium]
MPRLSDTMTEGVLSRWVKQPGDTVHRGDVLAEIETDKATMELEAYDEGVLERTLVVAGTTVPIGVPIATIGDGSNVDTSAPPATRTPTTAATEPGSTPASDAAPTHLASGSVRTSPLARAIAREHGMDIASVIGTGPGGRIVRADVEAAVASMDGVPAPVPAREPSPSSPGARGEPADPAVSARPADERIPLTAIRRVTARRLTASAAVPHFYLTSVVDAERLLAFRGEVNNRLASDGTKISVTDLLVRACAITLRAHPQANSSWADDAILRHRHIHIGVAVALEDGLIVPVVRDADRKSVGEIATELLGLAGRARAGQLTPDEFTGGTFTISNLGMFGIDHFTALINPPEAAILAVGAATHEPVVREDRVVAGTTIKLTLSVDHRVLDGATAAAFLHDLRLILEEPLHIVV